MHHSILAIFGTAVLWFFLLLYFPDSNRRYCGERYKDRAFTTQNLRAVWLKKPKIQNAYHRNSSFESLIFLILQQAFAYCHSYTHAAKTQQIFRAKKHTLRKANHTGFNLWGHHILSDAGTCLNSNVFYWSRKKAHYKWKTVRILRNRRQLLDTNHSKKGESAQLLLQDLPKKLFTKCNTT